VALAGIAIGAMRPVWAAPEDEIKAAFSMFVAAQNAHDLKAIGKLLSDSPDFLWTDPGHVVRTRSEALKRFEVLFQGAWRIDPAWLTFHIVMLDVSTAEVFVHVWIDDGAPARLMRMNHILVNTARGWRVSTILADKPQR
jgi:ketosteroid isomerase-like protein